MVDVKKDLQSIWFGSCDVFVYEKAKDKYGITSTQKKILYEKLKCRLSYKNITNANQTENASLTTQVIKLFLDNELEIPAGTFFVVTQNGITRNYRHSGVSAVYTNHQEIILELEQEKA